MNARTRPNTNSGRTPGRNQDRRVLALTTRVQRWPARSCRRAVVVRDNGAAAREVAGTDRRVYFLCGMRSATLNARRVGIDSASVFLQKIDDSRIARTKAFQLATIVQNVGAVGLFATDIPYGANPRRS